MEYARVLSGREDPLPIFSKVVEALDNFEEFPFLLEPIYREASDLGDEDLDRFRFGLSACRSTRTSTATRIWRRPSG